MPLIIPASLPEISRDLPNIPTTVSLLHFYHQYKYKNNPKIPSHTSTSIHSHSIHLPPQPHTPIQGPSHGFNRLPPLPHRIIKETSGQGSLNLPFHYTTPLQLPKDQSCTGTFLWYIRKSINYLGLPFIVHGILPTNPLPHQTDS